MLIVNICLLTKKNIQQNTQNDLKEVIFINYKLYQISPLQLSDETPKFFI